MITPIHHIIGERMVERNEFSFMDKHVHNQDIVKTMIAYRKQFNERLTGQRYKNMLDDYYQIIGGIHGF